MIPFLFIDTERVWRGGQHQLLTLLRGLSSRGHRIHLACHPGTLLEERARAEGAIVHPLAIRREFALFPYLRLRSIIRKARPEILGFNTPRPIFLGNLVSRRSSVRARIIFRRVNFPLHDNFFTRLKYTWGIDCIVAISESIRQQLQAGGVPTHIIRTIYEGLDLSLIPERDPGKIMADPDNIVIGTLASLSPEKGLSFLVEAATRMRHAGSRLRFVIVGAGVCRADLELQVSRERLQDAFQFVGFQDNTLPFLHTFDIFVLPSLSEGLSSAILAAMASSLPVVATNVGGIPELVQSGYNGLLVPPGDAPALADAILRLVNNPQEAREMGRMGRKIVGERFTLERQITESESLCEALVR